MRFADVDFLIIGAAKSATTWLQKAIQADPMISMPDPEPHYFSREFARGETWYLAQFPPDAAIRVAGEKSNSYLERPEAAERIARRIPDARLVVQLRNPVERAYSDYCMMYRRGEVSGDVERYLDPAGSENTRFVSTGLYHRQLRAYFDRFPAENILVTLYENATARPAQHVATVRQFLGLPGDGASPLIDGRIKDRTVPMLSPAMRRFLRPLKPIVAPFRTTLPFRRAHAALAREICYPPFPDALRRRLIGYYEPEVALLERLLGYDLAHWLCEPTGAGEDHGWQVSASDAAANAQNRKSPQGFN